jgi:hypothetical protein
VTLIAFHARKAGADILTDTLSYTPQAETVGVCTKVHLISHMDAAVAMQGTEAFSGRIVYWLKDICRDVDDFDGLVTYLPAILREAFELVQAERREHLALGVAVHEESVMLALVGYSTAQQRFQGWVFASPDQFEPEEHTNVFIYPAPLSCAPSRYELTSGLLAIAADKRQPEANKVKFARWLDKPPALVPQTERDWVELGKAARYDRALVDHRVLFKVLLGGDLFRTRLAVGEQTAKRIHRFNDKGTEFAQLLAGLNNPISLSLPCQCGSGRPYGDCCWELMKARDATARPAPTGSR